MRIIDADALVEDLMYVEMGKVHKFCFPCKEILQKIDAQPTIEQPTVAYLCDREKCGEKCSAEEGICKHTFDIRHAKNFKKISDDVFVEGDGE